MTNIKSHTDLQQSKNLAEILPLESADMMWEQHYNNEPYVTIKPHTTIGKSINCHCCNCWSLAALLNILAKIANKIDDDGSVDLSSFMGQWSVNMFDCPVEATDNYDNPIDACVAMIEKLHELKIL